MIILKSREEIEILRKANQIVAEILYSLVGEIRPGMTSEDLDRMAEEKILERGGSPAFKGYQGYPATLCASVNEGIIHGVPNHRKFQEGDIVSLDLGVLCQGYYGDSALSLAVGMVSPEKKHLLQVTQEALWKGIEQGRSGNRLGDISHAVQTHVERNGFSVVREFVGHGIGKDLHEEPQIPNYGEPHQGPRLREGMVLCIEPMVNAGGSEVEILEDGWTAVTADRSPSAHFEHTIVITNGEPEILTLVKQ
ncbi:type I methionyl aminopeptidase [candidate division TA06 bacterium]|nr:type I methionyl aminopeptidase [candidate division TA06 bacterium]